PSRKPGVVYRGRPFARRRAGRAAARSRRVTALVGPAKAVRRRPAPRATGEQMASARSDAFGKAARATLGDTPTKPPAKQRRQARAGRAFGLAGGLVLAVAGAAVAGPPYV